MRHDLGDRFDVFSAGSEKTFVKPPAISAMRTLGIDISEHRSKTTDAFIGQDIDYVVSVCDNARDTYPFLAAKVEKIHQAFVDPSNAEGDEEAKVKAFIASAQEIRAWLQQRFGTA